MMNLVTRKDFRKQLGAWLQRNRVTLGLTQQEVAEAIGVSEAAVSKWERCENDVSAYSERRLRSLFKRLWARREAVEDVDARIASA